ncbi:hypothetical protein F0562_013487 [Nyssa sinensis]|uniref:WEB family protein n=1 Tax=Nyssa sinensis TaxID=561372 RepID=A0A5J4ZQ86_9ASTE|nr:hypothetical protein F0562_013487 [Nyssa sinensis]
MFGFGIRTRQNVTGSPRATDTPRTVASPRTVGTPRTSASPKTEVGEIDTRAPFQSVRAAVSLFGEGASASPKAKPLIKKPKTAEERVLEKETHLHLALKELDKFKQHLRSAETTKAQALRELEKANRTLHELTSKLEIISESKHAAISATESAKKRAKQLEDEKSIRPKASGSSKQDVDIEREHYKASAAELIAAKQELTNIRQDFDAALEAKLTAFQRAADAQHAAKVNRERLSELSKEVLRMRETLGQVKLASLQAQEEGAKVMAEKEANLQSHATAKEEIEKKILSLKEEYTPLFEGNIEEKLEETTEAIGVIEEQLKNVQASDLESLRTATLELDDSKMALQQVSEEESSLRIWVASLQLELENVKRDHSESKEKAAQTETVSESLQVEVEKSKLELELALAEESKRRDAAEDGHLRLQQLSSETEDARWEAEEMKRKAEEMKQEAEAAEIMAKEVEEKLQVAMREAEEAKAAEKVADDQIHVSSARATDGTNAEFSNKIKLSTEEFESLSRKPNEFEKTAEQKVGDALAQVEEISGSEREAIERLEASLKEIEDIKAATEEALKKAKMDEGAKQMVEGELRKWRQQEQKKPDGETASSQEETEMSPSLQL